MDKVSKTKVYSLIERLVNVGLDAFNQQNIADSLNRIKTQILALKSELKEAKATFDDVNFKDNEASEKDKLEMSNLGDKVIPAYGDIIDEKKKQLSVTEKLITSYQQKLVDLDKEIRETNVKIENLNVETQNYYGPSLEVVAECIERYEQHVNDLDIRRHDASVELADFILQRSVLNNQIKQIQIKLDVLRNEYDLLKARVKEQNYIDDEKKTLAAAQIELLKGKISELESNRELLSTDIKLLGDEIIEMLDKDESIADVEEKLKVLDKLANHYPSLLKPVPTNKYHRVVNTATKAGISNSIDRYQEMILSTENAQTKKGLDISKIISQIIAYQNMINEYRILLSEIALLSPKEQMEYKDEKKTINSSIKSNEAKIKELNSLLNDLVNYKQAEKRLQQTISLKMGNENLEMVILESGIEKETLLAKLQALEVVKEALNYESTFNTLSTPNAVKNVVEIVDTKDSSVIDDAAEVYEINEEPKETLDSDKEDIIKQEEIDLGELIDEINEKEKVEIINENEALVLPDIEEIASSITPKTLYDVAEDVDKKPNVSFENLDNIGFESINIVPEEKVEKMPEIESKTKVTKSILVKLANRKDLLQNGINKIKEQTVDNSQVRQLVA